MRRALLSIMLICFTCKAICIDYDSIVTDEWEYSNIWTQTILGAVGFASMYISFGTSRHFWRLTQRGIADIFYDRIKELGGVETGEMDPDEELIKKMKA